MHKVNPESFVEGRDAYVARIPLLDVIRRIGEIEAGNKPDGSESFVLGFVDGMLSDLRDCADNARDELAARK